MADEELPQGMKQWVESILSDKPLDDSNKREFICEACGRKETLTDRDAFNQGWDYPPFMAIPGVVSPRTCGLCPITATTYWKIITGHENELNEHDLEVIRRIEAEVDDA